MSNMIKALATGASLAIAGVVVLPQHYTLLNSFIAMVAVAFLLLALAQLIWRNRAILPVLVLILLAAPAFAYGKELLTSDQMDGITAGLEPGSGNPDGQTTGLGGTSSGMSTSYSTQPAPGAQGGYLHFDKYCGCYLHEGFFYDPNSGYLMSPSSPRAWGNGQSGGSYG